MAMFPIFLIGVVIGVVLAGIIFYFIKTAPSNAKFKIQEEQLKNAQADLRMFEEELIKARNQIEKLKIKKKEIKRDDKSTGKISSKKKKS